MTDNGDIDAYVEACTEPESEYLNRLWRAANIHTVHGRMASGHVQGRFLKMVVSMMRPNRVLEVGTFSGYSALCMAEGLTCEGHLWTFEINDEMEDFTRPWIEGSPWSDRITFIIGDAIEEAPRLGLTFDLAFIDGDKRTYCQTYQAVKPLMRKGGIILADNTLWDGHVIDPKYDRDDQTLGIRRFNRMVCDDPTVENVMLPLRDGLTMIRVRDDES